MYQDARWITAMLDTPGVDAIGRFDIANVHLRGGARTLAGAVKRWRAFFSRRGFRGQLWVTEHGYPANTPFQYDRSYRGGEAAQAAFLRRSLPALRKAGASQVFVTLRDSWRSEFVRRVRLRGRDLAWASGRRSPSGASPRSRIVTALNRRWRKATRYSTLRRKHLQGREAGPPRRADQEGSPPQAPGTSLRAQAARGCGTY